MQPCSSSRCWMSCDLNLGATIPSVEGMSTTVWALTSVSRFTMFGGDVGDGSFIWKRFRSKLKTPMSLSMSFSQSPVCGWIIYRFLDISGIFVIWFLNTSLV